MISAFFDFAIAEVVFDVAAFGPVEEEEADCAVRPLAFALLLIEVAVCTITDGEEVGAAEGWPGIPGYWGYGGG